MAWKDSKIGRPSSAELSVIGSDDLLESDDTSARETADIIDGDLEQIPVVRSQPHALLLSISPVSTRSLIVMIIESLGGLSDKGHEAERQWDEVDGHHDFCGGGCGARSCRDRWCMRESEHDVLANIS